MRILYLALIVILAFNGDLIAQDQSSASVLETPVTLSISDQPLQDVLEEITRRYNIEFSYSNNILDVGRKVTLQIEKHPLKDVLEELLSPVSIAYVVVNDRIVFKKEEVPLYQTVRGKIIDNGSKAPISGAAVFLLDTDPVLGAVSDSEGNFKIEKVPIGRHALHVSHVGYAPYYLSSVLIVAGKEVVLPIALSEDNAILEEVVISEAKNYKSEKNLDLISQHQLKIHEARRYASSLNDPARLVSSVPGVYGDDFMENAIVIRGNSSRGLLWRVEGIDLPNPNHFAEEGASGGGVSIISAYMLDNSQLLTGAFPARYGNALSGVLDLQLRNGNNEKREYYVQLGTMGLDMAMEGPFKKGKSASYLVNYRYSSFSLLDNAGFDVRPSNTATRFQDASFKINLATKNKSVFSLFGIGGISSYEHDSIGMRGEHESKMGILGLTHDLQINTSSFLKSSLSVSETGNQETREYSRSNSNDYYKKNLNRSFLRVSAVLHKKFVSSHLLETGFSYNRWFYDFHDGNSDNSVRPSYFDDNGDAGLTQAYASVESKFGKRWQLKNGIHIMYFGLNDKISIEPRTAINLNLSSGHNIYAAFGLHSRIEPLQYYFARYTLPDSTETSFNRKLDFTKSRHYVLGYSYTISSHLSMKLEGYYQDMYNIAIRNDSASIFSSVAVYEGFSNAELFNRGQGSNYGIELSLDKRFAHSYYMNWNGSVYNATYVTGSSWERNTPYNGSFNTHLLIGKEFILGSQSKRKTIGVNFRAVWRGGKRYIPIDLNKSKELGFEVPDFQRAYEDRMDDYRRLDFQIVYRFNMPKFTGEWRLDIFNTTAEETTTRIFYDVQDQKIGRENQLGTYPVLSYKMEF